MKLLLSLALVALAAGPAAGMYGADSAVRRLTPANFDAVLGRTAQPTFVKFYAPWCGHCQSLEPEYERAAARTRGIAKFYAVNCDDEENRGLCARYNIEGFPTLKVFTAKRTKRGRRQAVDYQGRRKASAMAAFARSMLPSLSKKVAVDGLDVFVSTGDLPKAVLVTKRSNASDLWRGIAAHFDRRVQFGHVVDPDTAMLERIGIYGLPAVVVFPTAADPAAFELYTGETNYLSLAKFIHSMVVARKQPKTQQVAQPPHTNSLSVEQITSQTDLERLCIQADKDSPIPVLCIIGILALDPKFDESQADHALAVKVLENVLAGQQVYSTHTPMADNDPGSNSADADVDKPGDGSDSTSTSNRAGLGIPLRVAWVNALGAAGQRFCTIFGLSDNFPTVVAISPHRHASAPFYGPFSAAEILSWAEHSYKGHGLQHFTSELSIANLQAGHDEL